MTTQSFRPRGKTFVGLTSKERCRQLQSLDGFSAYASPSSQEKSPRFCSSCKSRRQRIVELEQEFRDLRERLLSKRTVLDVLDTSTENMSSSPTELALIQESAKLRITIDTLMRFQVRTNRASKSVADILETLSNCFMLLIFSVVRCNRRNARSVGEAMTFLRCVCSSGVFDAGTKNLVQLLAQY